MKQPTLLFAALAALVASSTIGLAQVPTLSFKSAAKRTAVVELYTSEGCSSCPPADRWFSSLKAAPGLFQNFVPVAFHVDYWDDLGWKDRFARSAYSERQRLYAQSGALSQVYTPGFLLQGHEWRTWSSGAVALQSDGASVGPLELTLDGHGGATLRWWPAREPTARLLGTLMLLGNELSSAVRSGENAGHQLHHDFVALAYSSGAMVRDNDHYSVSLKMPASSTLAPRYAVAAWVNDASRLAPLQAVGGWLAAP